MWLPGLFYLADVKLGASAHVGTGAKLIQGLEIGLIFGNRGWSSCYFDAQWENLLFLVSRWQ